MITVKVVCKGLRPLLMNPGNNDAILDNLRGGSGARKPKNRDLSVYDEAAGKIYRDADGNVGIPTLNLFAALVEAGRDIQFAGKRNISTATSTKLYSFMNIREDFLPFMGKPTWIPDKRRGTNPNGGEMVVIVRPRFDEWSFQATVDINEERAAPERAQQLFQEAGLGIGLCDFRPARRGPFGQFEVAEWKVIASGKPANNTEEPEVKAKPGRRSAVAAATAIITTGVSALVGGLVRVIQG